MLNFIYCTAYTVYVYINTMDENCNGIFFNFCNFVVHFLLYNNVVLLIMWCYHCFQWSTQFIIIVGFLKSWTFICKINSIGLWKITVEWNFIQLCKYRHFDCKILYKAEPKTQKLRRLWMNSHIEIECRYILLVHFAIDALL